VLIAYAPTCLGRGAGFIWDDGDHVLHNPNLLDLPGLWRSWTVPTSLPQWYPLVHTTFWVEHHLWGDWARGYHLVNVALHGIASLLLWRLLLRLGLTARAAWLGAALWAVHPVCAESVAWVTERKNTLMAVFYFATGLALLRWNPDVTPSDLTSTESAHVETPPLRWRWYALACLLFLLALTSKTVAATLPAAYLVTRWWKRGRLDLRRDLLPMLPLLAVGWAFARTTANLEAHHVGAHGADWAWTYAQRTDIAGRGLWFYAASLAWPVGLSFIYERWTPTTAPLPWIWPLAALTVFLSLWLARRQIGRGPLAATLLFSGIVLPALGFVDVFPHRYSFVADHFQYVASACLLAAAGYALSRIPARAGTPISIACLGILTALTAARATVMRDELTLWQDASQKSPHNPMVWANLARAYREQPNPNPPTATETYARQIRNIQLLTKAQSLATTPGVLSDADLALGYAYEQIGDLPHAQSLYQQAVAARPENTQAWYNLACTHLKTGDLPQAQDAITHALTLNPTDPTLRSKQSQIHAATTAPTTQPTPSSPSPASPPSTTDAPK
jgi:hypothetical protein